MLFDGFTIIAAAYELKAWDLGHSGVLVFLVCGQHASLQVFQNI